MFAKLYTTKVGQVLIKMDTGETHEPEVRFYFEPENLGVCSIAYKFKDTEHGWKDCQKLFHDSNELQAEGIAIDAIEKANGVMNGGSTQ